MSQTQGGWKKYVLVLCCLAASSAQAREAAADALEAQEWLSKIRAAAQRLNYAGTFVYQQGTLMRTSRITHMLDGHNEVEKLEVLDGQPREYIRNNEEIISYIPERRTLLVEKRIIKDVFPALVAATPAQLAAHYAIQKGHVGRVAGHDAQLVMLEPRDKLRYGYRLWADRKTGLLLRAQTVDESGRVLEQIAFTQVFIGPIDRAQVRPSYTQLKGWRVENTEMNHVDLSDWRVNRVPAGFAKIQEVQRLLSEAQAEEAVASPAARELSQIVFSDGLAAISVFIEPGSQSRTEGSLQQGALNIVGKRLGDFWLTIVGEVPAEAIGLVANSIEYKPTK